MKNEAISKELGEAGLKTYNAVKSLKSMIGVSQARIPFEFQMQQ